MKRKEIKKGINWNRFWKNLGHWIVDTISGSYRYVIAHWPRYLLSLLTGTFTWMAAFIMTGEVYYALMAVILAEGMFLYWLSRFDWYENSSQKSIVIFMFTISCLAIFLTDIASAVLIVNQNDQAAFYRVMPEWVGWVITNSTPYLSAFNLVAYGLYEFFSDSARDKREDATRRREIDRVMKATKRDVTKLRSRGKVLRVLRVQDKVQAKHQRQYGNKLVQKVDGIMKLELMQNPEDQLSWITRLTNWIQSIRNKKENNNDKPKKSK